MKCRECPDYAKCVKESNLAIKRKNCPKAKTEKVKTNADRIRAMSDEDLAVFLERTQADVAFNNKSKYAFEWEKWLKQPAE